MFVASCGAFTQGTVSWVGRSLGGTISNCHLRAPSRKIRVSVSHHGTGTNNLVRHTHRHRRGAATGIPVCRFLTCLHSSSVQHGAAPRWESIQRRESQGVYEHQRRPCLIRASAGHGYSGIRGSTTVSSLENVSYLKISTVCEENRGVDYYCL